jgi:hypothetical protein
MSLRPPNSLAPGGQPETDWSVLNYELAQQKAQTFGNLGAQVEEALARLRAFDAGEHGGADPTRPTACGRS